MVNIWVNIKDFFLILKSFKKVIDCLKPNSDHVLWVMIYLEVNYITITTLMDEFSKIVK